MLEKAIEKTGVKFLGWSENGFRELTTSKGPIEKPEDMKGMKLRVCGTPIFIDIFSVNFQRFPTLDAKKLVNAPKMSAHHRGICHF